MTDLTNLDINVIEAYKSMMRDVEEVAKSPMMVDGLLSLIFDENEEVRRYTAQLMTLLPETAPHYSDVRATIMTAFHREKNPQIRFLLARKIDEFAQEQDADALRILQESAISDENEAVRNWMSATPAPDFSGNLRHANFATRIATLFSLEEGAIFAGMQSALPSQIDVGKAADLQWFQYDDGSLTIRSNAPNDIASAVRLTLHEEGDEERNYPVCLVLYDIYGSSGATLRLPVEWKVNVASVERLKMERINEAELREIIRDSYRYASESEGEKRPEMIAAWRKWIEQLPSPVDESVRRALPELRV